MDITKAALLSLLIAACTIQQTLSLPVRHRSVRELDTLSSPVRHRSVRDLVDPISRVSADLQRVLLRAAQNYCAEILSDATMQPLLESDLTGDNAMDRCNNYFASFLTHLPELPAIQDGMPQQEKLKAVYKMTELLERMLLDYADSLDQTFKIKTCDASSPLYDLSNPYVTSLFCNLMEESGDNKIIQRCKNVKELVELQINTTVTGIQPIRFSSVSQSGKTDLQRYGILITQYSLHISRNITMTTL